MAWGRVLLCGRVALDEEPNNAVDAGFCLTTPHVLRSVSNVRMQQIFSSCVSDHAVFLSVRGDAYVYGCNKHGQCGVSPAAGSAQGGPWLSDAVKLDRQRDFVPSLPDGASVTAAATGAGHTLLLTSQGTVYAAGANAQGQCGLAPRPALYPFHRVGVSDPVVDVSCGRAYSALVTASGHVYTMGSAEHGVLGTGLLSWHHRGPNNLEHDIQAAPTRIPSLQHIARVSCGEDHMAALDHDGQVYVWGRNELARLGCGTQRDQGRPVHLVQLDRKAKQERAQAILAGRTSTLVLDREARLWIAGTWRTAGDGGPGQTFIIYKPLDELAEYDVHAVAAGANTMQCLATPTLDGQPIAGTRPMVLAWGDGAQHAEFGLMHHTATPDMLIPLQPLAPLAVAAGRHTSFWLVKPDQAYSELPRFPETIESVAAAKTHTTCRASIRH
ncbi:hypothetical protein MCAP1_003331 [Malassezia caprae]|uniref:RCC1-like domain-containing protein n=1 Tax=Malassezia caprae TaxID=1381934 RepID=A0AAF0E8S7_9BASI|nr:hypothetical protein MCAP1_003331 [Malassezia caprae]